MPIDKTKITKEMAAKCKTPEELIELAKEAGFELTTEQAQAYLDELENVELDEATLNKVAGGCNLRGQTKWSHAS